MADAPIPMPHHPPNPTRSFVHRQMARPQWQLDRDASARRLRAAVLNESTLEHELQHGLQHGLQRRRRGGLVGPYQAIGAAAADNAHALTEEEREGGDGPEQDPAEAAMDEEVIQLHATLKSKIESRFSELRRAFRLIDLDKSGSCDRGEMRTMLESMFNLVVPAHVMERLLDLIDLDGSGDIVLSEFNRFFTTSEPLDIRTCLTQLRWRRRGAQAGGGRGY